MSAEPKRVSFMTIDSSTDLLKKPEKESTSAGNNKSKTIRLELEIYEPDARRNSDFNYKKLIHIEKKKQKKLSKLPNGVSTPEKANDPFGDDEDDIARIAREMEAKYGTGSSYGGKSSAHDYDRGIGYDDNDSFIDNTEAYDEIIPEDIDTVRGGFYVNSGLLEFKKIPNFERPGDEIRMPKAKKRALSTSSESSDGEDQPNQESTPAKSKKKKKHMDKKAKSATSSSDEQGKAAKKAKKDKPEKQKVEVPAVPTTPSPAVVVKEPEKKKENVLDDSKKVVKTTTVKDMLRAKRDNLRKLEQGKSSGGTTTTTDNDDDDGSESIGSSLAVSESSRDSHNGEINGGTTTTTTTATKELSLPSTFSADLIQLITSLKQHTDSNLKNSTSQNFFDNNVKEQLLQIDTVAKSQSTQVRLQVYQQLETFLPCNKKAILTKVSRYRTQQAESKIKSEIKKLKTIVNDTMPDLLHKFDDDQRNYVTQKEINTVVGEAIMETKSPRKKYHWNENSRQILSDTLAYIHELFKISKVKKETLEEFSARYLKEHLLPLWPEGWIKFEDFQKELERKKKRDARSSQGSNSTVSPPSNNNVNGKQSAQTPSPHHHQKTESRTKEVDITIPVVNGKSSAAATASIQLSPQSSVIKKSSDHSINSIMSSSPSPPIHSSSSKTAVTTPAASPSTSVLVETKTRVIDLDKLSSPNDLLKVSSQKDIKRTFPKYSESIMASMDVNHVKVHRISSGSDSDCAIIDSPVKPTPTPTQATNFKVQPQINQHLNNNKINHSPVMIQQQPVETKETKKIDNVNYDSLIKNIASLTSPKTSSSQSNAMNNQQKMDTYD